MQLKLARSQREGGVVSKTVIFCLDARVQLTPEEQASVARYRLGNEVVYNSRASEKHLASYQENLKQGGVGGTVRALGSLALVALNLNIRINDLQRGQHIECKNLSELLSAEDAIMEACKTLRAFLEAAATFDGREVFVSFEGPEPTVLQTYNPPMLVAPAYGAPPPAAPTVALAVDAPPSLSAPGPISSDSAASAQTTSIDDFNAALWNSPTDIAIAKLQSFVREGGPGLWLLLGAAVLLLFFLFGVATS